MAGTFDSNNSASRHLKLPTPSTDLAVLNDVLGQAWGVSCGESLRQYLAWADQSGLLSVISELEPASLEELVAVVPLSERGADALLCILAAMAIVVRDETARYRLSALARDYLLAKSPFYIGHGLYLNCEKPIPSAYLKTHRPAETLNGKVPMPWPVEERLEIQHSRNFAASVVAVRTGQFKAVRHIVDLAGGSGVFAIPLAIDHPAMSITLVELPEVLGTVRHRLQRLGLEKRIRLVGLDVFADDWSLGCCDGIVMGNLYHFEDDDACRLLSRKSFKALDPGGRLWIHEVLLNEERDGPLLAALWNANMLVRKEGARQRTALELSSMLMESGFVDCGTTPTSSHFSLISARKPA